MEGTREDISKIEGTREAISKLEGAREDVSKITVTRQNITTVAGKRENQSKSSRINPVITVTNNKVLNLPGKRKTKGCSVVLKELLMRTSSLLTIFIFITLVLYIPPVFLAPNSSWIWVVKKSLLRLSYYVLIVLLVIFDKDVLSYLADILNY